MKTFLHRLINFSLIGIIPLTLLLSIYIFLDPFKVIYSYEIFYDSSATGWVGLNKDYVSTSTFLNGYKKNRYNSFIFGNSRSIFYQTSDWEKYLSEGSSCFHFDASGETLFGIGKKIEFIDSKGLVINNVLIVIDYKTLLKDTPGTGHLFVISPVLVDGSNYFEFHSTFFKAFITPNFLFAYFDFLISGKVKPYMKKEALLDDKPKKYNVIQNEIRYDYFEDLIDKGKYYTPERLSVFYKRDTILTYSPEAIKNSQKEILQNIARILKRQNANTKIIISPTYDQEKLNPGDLKYLEDLFGKNSVHDFSGINQYTSDFRNYYETSHYRPHVARMILEEVYKTK